MSNSDGVLPTGTAIPPAASSGSTAEPRDLALQGAVTGLAIGALAGGVFFRLALADDELAEGAVNDLVEFTLRGVTAT